MSLRDALEKRLGSLPLMTYVENDYPVRALPEAELLDLLAGHPVEPAPVASRERVAEVLHESMLGQVFLQHPEPQRTRFTRQVAARQADALLAAGVFREPPTPAVTTDQAPRHDCVMDDNLGCPACAAEGIPTVNRV